MRSNRLRAFHQTVLLEVVVTGTIGDRRRGAVVSAAGVRMVAGGVGSRLAGQDVENDIGRVDAVGRAPRCKRFLDRRQPVGQHRGEDVDHLPIAIIGTGELTPYALAMAAGGTQSLNGAPPLRRAPGLRASTGT